MLWDAREQVSMLADIVEARTGRVDHAALRLRMQIDQFRREQGWSPDGFGGEEGPLHEHDHVPVEGTNRLVCSCGETLYSLIPCADCPH